MLGLQDKYFKLAIINMLKEIKENVSKELKKYETMSYQRQKVNKEKL